MTGASAKSENGLKIDSDGSAAPKLAAKIGEAMPDSSIYGGISPETGKAMYTTQGDAPATYTFDQAKDYAATLDANGHKDWRVPTKGELNVLFQNRAAIGEFNETGSYPAGWYWSSSPSYGSNGWAQRFSDGHQHYDRRDVASSLRCVR